jgi:hypothetical protein
MTIQDDVWLTPSIDTVTLTKLLRRIDGAAEERNAALLGYIYALGRLQDAHNRALYDAEIDQAQAAVNRALDRLVAEQRAFDKAQAEWEPF